MLKRKEAFKKLKILMQSIKKLERVAVAYSSGVDSTFLLKVAHDVLGKNATALTAHTSAFTETELAESMFFCKENGIEQEIIALDLLCIPAFQKNAPDKCYHCKKHIFQSMLDFAGKHGISYLLEGSNVDDDGDYRPGHRAIAELNIISPLREAGLTKEEIRFLSSEFGLYTWNKPSFACLASRFAYGDEITEEKLEMVKIAERYLARLGLKQYRVRVHGTIARIEILPEDFHILLKEDIRIQTFGFMKRLGYDYVTLDLAGYQTGSMNLVLKDDREVTK